MVENTQQEVFIINDIEMEIGPSDIQVMDDNWVMEDSYLRSKAVFCYRSQYSATKVVLSIPFQISYLNEESKAGLNNTYNCIKLISELDSYPFCFIKNNRIKAYVSPSSMSVTDYMLFAVDEIAIVQDAKASNVLFLEVVLQYYNHNPLIKDFEFKSNLNVATDPSTGRIFNNTDPAIVESLRSSAVWKEYMNPRVKRVLSNLVEKGFLDYTETDNKSLHPLMGVKILAPTMSVVSQDRDYEGRFVGPDAKLITVADTSQYDEGTFENLLSTLTMQDFSFEAPEYQNAEKYVTINSEDRIKQGVIKTSKKVDTKINNPFGPGVEEDQSLTDTYSNVDKAEGNINRNAKNVLIDWVGHDIQALAMGVQKIEVRKKNRLVSHQIGSFKHPIVQYMGKYPVTVNVTMVSTNFDVYKSSEPPATIFLKHVLNVLDYNRQAIPEAEGYNFLKIQSLATTLLNCESFLPSQNLVSASSANQGVESIVYSFSQGDLTEFIEQGLTESTNRNEIDHSQFRLIEIIVEWLKGAPSELKNILMGTSTRTSTEQNHILSIYKSIVELTKEAMVETSMNRYPQFEGIETVINYISDLKPGNNVLRKVQPISTEYTKELSKYRLYKEAKVEIKDRKVSQNDYLDSKYGGPDSSYFKEQAKVFDNAINISTLNLHMHLIDFLVFILKTRANIMDGKPVKLPNLSFSPSGRFNNLLLSTISRIDSGLRQGAIVNPKSLNTEDVREELNKATENYAKIFFGYNIEDLDFEIFAPKGYNRATDMLIPKIDPFFFIQETSILDGNEFESIYDKMYAGSGDNKNLLETVNNNPNDEKDLADATMTNYGLHYRKLQEIDYNPEDFNNEISGMVGFLGAWGAGMAGVDLSGSDANAKKIDPKVITAIEKALKKYGKDKDEGFRSYMYAVLLKESGNGTKMRSPTGAVGLFQFTEIAVEDILRNKNNTLEYSNGQKVGSNSSSDNVKAVKAASVNDLYLGAQLFIERYMMQSKSFDTTKNGRPDAFYSFVVHNIGGGSLKDIRNVLERGAVSVSKSTIDLILTQSKSFQGRTDVETVRKYAAHMMEKLSVDNVPDSIRIDAKGITKGNAYDLVQNTKAGSTVSKTPAGNVFIPLRDPQKAKNSKSVVKTHAEALAIVNHEYKGITATKEDKVNGVKIGSKTITGTVTSVVDGDTIYVKDTTGKSHKVRLYGLDTPDQGEIYKDLATKALSDLTLGKKVSVNLGGTTYDREVGVVKLADGTEASLAMLRNGYGFLAEGFTVVGTYQKAQEEAKKKQAGIWAYPDGVVTKPRKETINLGNRTTEDLQNIKNNVNYEKFSVNDLTFARKQGKLNINSYQPFEGGRKYPVSSMFGNRIHPTQNVKKMHKGVDLAAPSGTRVVAAASGIVTASGSLNGYGGCVYIDHGNGFETRYAHLKQRLVKKGDRVVSQQVIGLSGGGKGDPDAGTSSGAHLHYEVRYKGEAINPFGTKELALYKPGENPGQMINTTYTMTDGEIPKLTITRTGVTPENTVYNEDKLAKAIFENIYKYTNTGLKTSLPAIKVYMTVGNENDKFWLDTLKGDVLYYEIKGVKSFHMNCNNDGNPIDTAFITIADPSFLNTDGFAGLSKMQQVNVNAIGTSSEMSFKNNRIQLKVGNKIHVRLGYGNSPNDLEIVFNGSIVEVENANQSLNLVCEGFGKELLSELFSTDKPRFMNAQNDNISTSSVIGESLSAETIEHFGYNSGFIADKFRGSTDPEDRSLAPGRLSLSYNWGYDFTKASYKSRLFMNVFAPEVEKLDMEFIKYKGWISNLSALFTNHMGGYPFAVYRMTPWQCIKQMEYRHPNTIAKPMLYEDRMTLFYGIKEQMYIKKDLSKALQLAAASQKESNDNGFDITTYAQRRRERLAPASNVHLVTSSNNLITNGLRLSSDYATKIKVNYYDSKSEAEDQLAWETETFEAKADDNLYPFDIRSKELTLSGCLGRYAAFLYGTTELKKEAEKMYRGKILVLGNPSMKSGDYIFIDDSEKRMHGLVLVRECYHHFDEKVGYITEIVPGQYVEAANFLYSSLWLNLMCSCKIVSSKMRAILGSNYSDKDFKMVSDYLTILKQAELAMDTVADKVIDKNVAAIYGATSTLSVLLLNSVSKTLGLGDKRSVLKFLGLNVSAGVVGFSKIFYEVFTNKVDLFLSKTAFEYAKGKSNSWIDSSRHDIRGILKQPKSVIMSSQLYQKIKESKTASGLIWKSSKATLSLGSKATLAAAKLTGRALFSTLIAVSLANPLSIIVDVLVYMAIQYAFAKIEEEQMMRQPLLYFPIVRHGKPYVGGMAGVVRNTWMQSQIKESQKTFKEVKKAASVLVGNHDATNMASDRPFYISLLNGISKNDRKVSAPIYQTNDQGDKIVIAENKVTTEPVRRAKDANKLSEYYKDEENMKKLFLQKLNQGAVEQVTL